MDRARLKGTSGEFFTTREFYWQMDQEAGTFWSAQRRKRTQRGRNRGARAQSTARIELAGAASGSAGRDEKGMTVDSVQAPAGPRPLA